MVHTAELARAPISPPLMAAEEHRDQVLVSDSATDLAQTTQQLPVDPQGNSHNVSLVLLTVIAIMFVLQWASAFFIPLMYGIMISYALSPVVKQLHHLRIPRAIGAALLLLGIVGAASTLTYSLKDEAAATIEALPQAAQNFRRTLRIERGNSESAIEKVQKATTELEHAASDSSTSSTQSPQGVTQVQIVKSTFNIQDFLWSGSMGAVGFAGQVTMVLFLAYFLLVSGDSFRRKLVKISGPAFSKKKITLQVLDNITDQIQRFLLVQLGTSIIVGVATWLAFLWIGMEHAAVWGIAAAIVNAIPYLGAAIFTIAATLVSFLQFGTVGMVVLVSGVALLITSVEGMFLTPWLTSRASQMNPVVIFAGVLFWGWLWGVWGLLVGIPILMAIKAICDHVEDFKPIGEMLGK